MADISTEIALIQTATHGSELRSAIAAALVAINNDIPPQYSGSYSIIPSTISFSVAVSGYLMTQDLIVEAYPEAVLVSKVFTSNGTYYASSDSASGYSQVTVSLPMYTGAYSINPSTIAQTILTNGLLLSSNLTINAYPEAVLISKTATANGTYNASDDSASGYSQFVVSIPTYSGSYEITPSTVSQTFSVADLLMTQDLVVNAYEVPIDDLIMRTISAYSTAVSVIGPYAFAHCYQLRSVYLIGANLTDLVASNAFESTPIDGYTDYTSGEYGSIYVPASLYNDYITDSVWSYFSDRIVSVA